MEAVVEDIEAAEAGGAAGLSRRETVIWMGVAVGAFHVAYLVPPLAFLMVLHLYALIRLTEAATPRWAFYPALLAAIGCFAPHLWFFTGIFGFVAVSLWTIGAIWTGFFVLIAWSLRRVPWVEKRMWVWMLALPAVWMGLEYFRSELYYLKFAWLTPGIAMAPRFLGGSFLVEMVGAYGAGFVATLAAAFIYWRPPNSWHKIHILKILGVLLVAALLVAIFLPSLGHTRSRARKTVLVVGIQVEGPSASQILRSLDAAVEKYPDVALLVMSEYTLDSPPTDAIKAWCLQHGKYLILGGKQSMEGPSPSIQVWADTAFVINPKGEVVFSQGKSVPIQFFDDGVPALEQKVWDSPWGKMGICICYDLSYTRVTDELIRQGAQILVVPTMDAEKWGAYEHQLHARIAPVRAMEYNLPIIRVASSGISQGVDSGGYVRASAPFPGQGEIMAYTLRYPAVSPPHVPPDRYAAPVCVGVTGLIAAGLFFRRVARQLRGFLTRPRAPL